MASTQRSRVLIIPSCSCMALVGGIYRTTIDSDQYQLRFKRLERPT